MEESYLVCPERNSEAAYRRFYGAQYRYYPGWRQVARGLLRHRVTAGIIVAMNAAGALAYVSGLI